MKRTAKKLQLNLVTVRTLQPQLLDNKDLGHVVGGLKSGSGGYFCTNTSNPR